MDNWTKIGEVGVDAGLLSVGDPCYYDGFSYDNDCLPVVLNGYNKGEQYWSILPGGVMVFQTTWGDGVYPVYAKFDNHGRLTEVKVVMDHDDDDYDEKDETIWKDWDEEEEDEDEWDFDRPGSFSSREPQADDLLRD